MLLLWLKVVQRVLPVSPLAFPEFDGSPMGHLERKIEMATKPLEHSLPTATSFRKELEIRNKRQEGPMREAVSRALSHSLSTAQQYYQAPTLSDTYTAYNVIADIIRGDRATSPRLGEQKGKEKQKGKGKGRAGDVESDVSVETDVEMEKQEDEEERRGKGKKRRRSTPHEEEDDEERSSKRMQRREEEEERSSKRMQRREEEEERGQGKKKKEKEKEAERRQASSSASSRKRKAFTERQEGQITDFFKTQISTRQFPTSIECREFLALFPMQRSPKDIYDKCRNLSGR